MSLYEGIPTDLLAGFYFEILNNIKKGILIECMYTELELIEEAVKSRGMSLVKLHQIYHSEREQLIMNAKKSAWL